MPRLYDWARVAIRPLGAPDQAYWLLVRRSLADPTELGNYVCDGPGETALAELVRVAGIRWAIEEGFEAAKGAVGLDPVGLDQYEVRKWPAWSCHITLALLAQAYHEVTRVTAKHDAGKKGEVRPS